MIRSLTLGASLKTSSKTSLIACMVAGIAASIVASPAMADLSVRFVEGAPKDRFDLTNTSDCTTSASEVQIDLSTAQVGLIFDTTDAGAGVEVFQPFDVTAGAAFLIGTPQVNDGDTALRLAVSGLPAGQRISFTIDLDDTGGGREITVSGSEIAGALVTWTGTGPSGAVARSGAFDTASEASVPLPDCDS